ncbi:hypothetical protein B7494_g7369 [Chlorociboria aeruginascens]|nr:hypothetical protein B7494_g7369 [Chlorociboria aeruginascens]
MDRGRDRRQQERVAEQGELSNLSHGLSPHATQRFLDPTPPGPPIPGPPGPLAPPPGPLPPYEIRRHRPYISSGGQSGALPGPQLQHQTTRQPERYGQHRDLLNPPPEPPYPLLPGPDNPPTGLSPTYILQRWQPNDSDGKSLGSQTGRRREDRLPWGYLTGRQRSQERYGQQREVLNESQRRQTNDYYSGSLEARPRPTVWSGTPTQQEVHTQYREPASLSPKELVHPALVFSGERPQQEAASLPQRSIPLNPSAASLPEPQRREARNNDPGMQQDRPPPSFAAPSRQGMHSQHPAPLSLLPRPTPFFETSSRAQIYGEGQAQPRQQETYSQQEHLTLNGRSVPQLGAPSLSTVCMIRSRFAPWNPSSSKKRRTSLEEDYKWTLQEDLKILESTHKDQSETRSLNVLASACLVASHTEPHKPSVPMDAPAQEQSPPPPDVSMLLSPEGSVSSSEVLGEEQSTPQLDVSMLLSPEGSICSSEVLGEEQSTPQLDVSMLSSPESSIINFQEAMTPMDTPMRGQLPLAISPKLKEPDQLQKPKSNELRDDEYPILRGGYLDETQQRSDMDEVMGEIASLFSSPQQIEIEKGPPPKNIYFTDLDSPDLLTGLTNSPTFVKTGLTHGNRFDDNEDGKVIMMGNDHPREDEEHLHLLPIPTTPLLVHLDVRDLEAHLIELGTVVQMVIGAQDRVLDLEQDLQLVEVQEGFPQGEMMAEGRGPGRQEEMIDDGRDHLMTEIESLHVLDRLLHREDRLHLAQEAQLAALEAPIDEMIVLLLQPQRRGEIVPSLLRIVNPVIHLRQALTQSATRDVKRSPQHNRSPQMSLAYRDREAIRTTPRERSPVRASTPKSPPRGPASSRAPPTGPSSNRNFSGPTRSPLINHAVSFISAHNRPENSPAIPPTGPRAQASLGFNRGPNYIRGGRGILGTDRHTRPDVSSWRGAPPSRTIDTSANATTPVTRSVPTPSPSTPSAPPTPISAPVGPSGIPTGPRAGPSITSRPNLQHSSTIYSRSSISLASGPRTHPAMANLQPIIPNGRIDPNASGMPADIAARLKKREEEADVLRAELMLKQEKLRKGLKGAMGEAIPTYATP